MELGKINTRVGMTLWYDIMNWSWVFIEIVVYDQLFNTYKIFTTSFINVCIKLYLYNENKIPKVTTQLCSVKT